MIGATASFSVRLIGSVSVANNDEKVDNTSTSFAAGHEQAARCVSTRALCSEASATNAWNQNYNTSNPGNQNNNNKTNNNRARAVRRSEAPVCNVTIEELSQAYYDCRRRKRNSDSALKFEQMLARNLMNLYHELHNHEYTPGQSVCFVILYPKPREVWAADFRDRIIHHLLYNRISDHYHQRFIADTCACIPGRGTLYAVDRLRKHARSITQDWAQTAWYLQMDLANFFVSINKQVLDGLLSLEIRDEYTLYLARLLLHHDPVTNAQIRSSQTLLAKIPPHKSLFNAKGDGLPIGNLTSQFFANVYLDPLDQFIKHSLYARHYIRYVDDIVILGSSSESLASLSKVIDNFAQTVLDVRFHPQKTRIQLIEHGIDFAGYVTRPHARYLRRRTIGRAYYRAHNECDNPQPIFNSYFGLMRHANCYHQRKQFAECLYQQGYRINSKLTKVIT